MQKFLSHSSLYTKAAMGSALVSALLSAQLVQADSVGQVQTTKYFAPETVAMLKQRVADVAAGVPGATLGFKSGDTISYIIQFTPIANTSTIGAGGYITDYIPSGAVVTGAWFVQPDGLGGFFQVSPPTSAKMATDNGVGAFTGWTPDAATLAICTAAGRTAANCTGRFPNLVADTGIFYSTDPRTQVFTDPSTDGRVSQWSAPTGNGYSVCPTRGTTQLPPLMGGTVTTCSAGGPSTHNYWDAAMTTAFATATATVVPSPTATNARIIAVGNGPAPFNAGSPVAGPDAGYQLDYTGNVGPWQRISYPGSTIGPLGLPATGTLTTTYVSVGTTTSAGASFPLPANTNAVRWAAGRLVVGTQSYVKISLQLTTAPPVAGLVNNSEVFGGDGSPEDGMPVGGGGGGGNSDNPWVYHVPSVASNVSTLYILKEVVCLYDTTGTCIPNDGANLPISVATVPATGPKVRYRISYINTNNGTQHNVTICDQLPDLSKLTPAAAQINFATQVTQVSATPNLGTPTSAAIAACKFTGAATTFNYPTIPVLAGGGAGVIEYDVQYPIFAAGNVNDNIVNGAKAVSTEIPAGVTSYAPLQSGHGHSGEFEHCQDRLSYDSREGRHGHIHDQYRQHRRQCCGPDLADRHPARCGIGARSARRRGEPLPLRSYQQCLGQRHPIIWSDCGHDAARRTGHDQSGTGDLDFPAGYQLARQRLADVEIHRHARHPHRARQQFAGIRHGLCQRGVHDQLHEWDDCVGFQHCRQFAT